MSGSTPGKPLAVSITTDGQLKAPFAEFFQALRDDTYPHCSDFLFPPIEPYIKHKAHAHKSVEELVQDAIAAVITYGKKSHEVDTAVKRAVAALIGSGKGEGTPLDVNKATKATWDTVETWLSYIKRIRKEEALVEGGKAYRMTEPVIVPFFDGSLKVTDVKRKKVYMEDKNFVDPAASLASNLYTKEFVSALITPHHSSVPGKINLILKRKSK